MIVRDQIRDLLISFLYLRAYDWMQYARCAGYRGITLSPSLLAMHTAPRMLLAIPAVRAHCWLTLCLWLPWSLQAELLPVRQWPVCIAAQGVCSLKDSLSGGGLCPCWKWSSFWPVPLDCTGPYETSMLEGNHKDRVQLLVPCRTT